MKTKLTLTIEEEAVSRVKRFAKRRGVSVSSLFEQWSARVADSDRRPPLGERLRGQWNVPASEQGLSDSPSETDPRMEYLLNKHLR